MNNIATRYAFALITYVYFSGIHSTVERVGSTRN